MVRAMRLDVVTWRESVDGEDRRFLKGVRPALSSAFYLGPGQPELPGGCGRGRDTGTIHLESGVACVPVETAGPTLGVHFSTCPPFPCPRLRSKMGQAPAYTVFLAEIERKGGPPGLGERQRRMGHWEVIWIPELLEFGEKKSKFFPK